MLTPGQQRAVLQNHAGVRERDDLCVVEVRGEDQRTWLNGQITVDVREPQPGHGVYGLVVTVKGKILADVWALDSGTGFTLLLPRATAARVLEGFERQIIMEDVTLHVDDTRCVMSVQGPESAKVIERANVNTHSYACDELGYGGQFVLGDTAGRATSLAQLVEAARACGGNAVDDVGFTLARVAAGVPAFGQDFDEKNYPQEAGLRGRAVSFNKGCYLGQEVICTLESRGRVNRCLLLLSTPGLAALTAGSEVTDPENNVIGSITSVAMDEDANTTWALGYAKRTALEAAIPLRTGTASLTVVRLIGD